VRSKQPITLRGLNKDHNHDLKDIFKGAAMRASIAAGPLHGFFEALLAKGRKPPMARLTLARKIAAITLQRLYSLPCLCLQIRSDNGFVPVTIIFGYLRTPAAFDLHEWSFWQGQDSNWSSGGRIQGIKFESQARSVSVCHPVTPVPTRDKPDDSAGDPQMAGGCQLTTHMSCLGRFQSRCPWKQRTI
jgi:hypothetical protein